MKINLLFAPVYSDELYFTGKTTVVIDVLRASSTIIAAVQNGAKEIVPVATIEFAMKVSGGMFGGQTLLGGERNTKKVEGFALGNSPLEYTHDLINSKSIIFYTTNGSKAIVKAKFSENLYICSFSNLSAVASRIIKLDKDLEILCAGRSNLFCMEDVVCGGRLINEIQKAKENIILTDSAKAGTALNKSFGKNLFKMLSETEHGSLLIENGFIEDVKYCSKLNTTDVIPYYIGNTVKLLLSEPKVETKAG